MDGARVTKVEPKRNSNVPWKESIRIASVLTLLIAVYLRRTQNLSNPRPIVKVSEGKLQGIVSYSRSGNEVYEFLSVPYAKKPIGHLRFESPQPVDHWEGVLEANTLSPNCMQIDIITQQKNGQEDCLYLNVYVPKTVADKSLLPVMAFIHGGFFMYGGVGLLGPKYFADENVILVTISYRLASFGFLNTGDGLVRGNMGLKDQVMSLQWIQRNIKNFGGDPNKVTIFGESVGGSSVHLHMLSSMSKGLFHRGISQSGTAISPYILSRHPVEQSKRLGRQLGCPTESSKELVECLRNIDAEKIVEVHRETIDLPFERITIFSATIETVKDSDAFLTAYPMDLLKQGKIVSKVPWINGVNSEEGLILAAVIAENETLLNGLENDWNRVAPKFLFYERNDTVSKLVRKKYFGKTKEIGKPENINKFTQMVSDRPFFWAASESGLLHSKVSPVYMYFYSHESEFSLAHFVTLFRRRFHYTVEVLADMALAWVDKHILGRRHHNYGVCHTDELFVMFYSPYTPDLTPQHGELYKMSKDVVKLWADFAKKGGDLSFRGVSWPQIDPSKTPLKYLLINSTSGIINEPFESNMKFWRENPVV